jgi:ribosomal protein S18 acetylase RimI-like enzyme/calcineurin-like phosphoesterase family protein
VKKIKCPICSEPYVNIEGLHTHIEKSHPENIPEGYSTEQYLYFIKTGKTHGSCVMCKKDTEWNDSTGKYKRFCNNPKCKEAYREMFKKRMTSKYGKTTLLNDPEQQRKMLAHRHISGTYEWSDGSKKSYTGSYELDFLKMLDVFMNFDSDDVMTPSPHTYYYIYEGDKKFYIPDVYIPSLNLEIEIKDGGDNPNMHHKIQNVDKVKERLKDDVMKTQKDIDYIKIMNKNYDGFFEYLLKKKEETANAKNIVFNNVTESGVNIDIVNESNTSKNNMPPGVTLRNATKDDIPNMFKWEMESIDKSLQNNPKVIRYIKGDVIRSVKTTKMIMYKGNTIGMLTTDRLGDGYWYIGEIYIIEEYRGRGIGSALLKDEISKHDRIKLQVAISNQSAIKLYKSLGFIISKKDNINKMYIMTLDKKSISEGYMDTSDECINAYVDSPPHIMDILDDAPNIWVTTDWHLWKYDKNTSTIYKNKNFNRCISDYNRKVGNDDVVIFLGDLVSDEFTDKNKLKHVLSSLRGTKILCKGNNDLFDDRFYYHCGFIHVCHKLVWNNILFTHIPIENDYDINVHGHIHGSMRYTEIKYTNQIDAYTDDGSLLDLDLIINSLPKYKKHIVNDIVGTKENSDMFFNNDDDVLTEATTKLNTINEYYDFDRFINGDTNILLVTGLLSSSKKAKATEIATYCNANIIDLDYINAKSINNLIDTGYDYVPFTEAEFLLDFAERHLRHDPTNPRHILPPNREEIILFIKMLFNHIDPNKRYVLHGIYIYEYYKDIMSLIDQCAIININEPIKSIIKSYMLAPHTYGIVIDKVDKWFNTEHSKYLEFRHFIADRRATVDKIPYKQKFYPVFVILTYSGSIVAKTIRAFTGDEFSHAMLSFDHTLISMYSFAKSSTSKSIFLGFTHEDARESRYYTNIAFAEYGAVVTASDLKKMKKAMYKINSAGSNIKYSYAGLVKFALNMPPETQNRMFCSEFVAYVLNAGKNMTDGNEASVIKPDDFKYMDKFELIQKGVMTEYNPAMANERMNMMLRRYK